MGTNTSQKKNQNTMRRDHKSGHGASIGSFYECCTSAQHPFTTLYLGMLK